MVWISICTELVLSVLIYSIWNSILHWMNSIANHPSFIDCPRSSWGSERHVYTRQDALLVHIRIPKIRCPARWHPVRLGVEQLAHQNLPAKYFALNHPSNSILIIAFAHPAWVHSTARCARTKHVLGDFHVSTAHIAVGLTASFLIHRLNIHKLQAMRQRTIARHKSAPSAHRHSHIVLQFIIELGQTGRLQAFVVDQGQRKNHQANVIVSGVIAFVANDATNRAQNTSMIVERRTGTHGNRSGRNVGDAMGVRHDRVTIDDRTAAEVSAISLQRCLPWELVHRRIATAHDALHILVRLRDYCTCDKEMDLVEPMEGRIWCCESVFFLPKAR